MRLSSGRSTWKARGNTRMRTSVAGESSERRYLSLEDVITLSLPSLSLPPYRCFAISRQCELCDNRSQRLHRLHCRNVYPWTRSPWTHFAVLLPFMQVPTAWLNTCFYLFFLKGNTSTKFTVHFTKHANSSFWKPFGARTLARSTTCNQRKKKKEQPYTTGTKHIIS